jgi:hypothetical protein
MMLGLHLPLGVGSCDNTYVEHQPLPGHLRRSAGPDARWSELSSARV